LVWGSCAARPLAWAARARDCGGARAKLALRRNRIRRPVESKVRGAGFQNTAQVRGSDGRSLEPGAVDVVFGASMAGDFTRPTPAPISQTNCAVTGQAVYQVRALALRVSGPGSYTNQGQGAFLIR
jgi:hypothetical protein